MIDAMPSTSSEAEFKKVVEGGFCIGCGACASRPDSAVSMQLDALGMYQPRLREGGRPPADFEFVCPFSSRSAVEDELAVERFPDALGSQPQIGRYVSTYAGYAVEGEYRSAGSSGGLATWVLVEMIERGLIDGVIHVKSQVDDDTLFRYDISTTAAQVRGGAKTRYYPIEMSEVVGRLRTLEGRFAFVGIPCFLKAMSRLRLEDDEIAGKITYLVGIVCGHLKSARFAEYLALTVGVGSGDIRTLDFRHKYLAEPADHYGFEVETRTGERRDRPMARTLGRNWGYSIFKYNACNFCDDVTAETADIVFGDAWLPQYTAEGLGTNIVIVRRWELDGLLTAAADAGRIQLDPLTADDIARSQTGGLHDRRDGLSFRLAMSDRAGAWRPPKRVAPSLDHTPIRSRIYELRPRIAQATHEAFVACRDRGEPLDSFISMVAPLVKEYDSLFEPSLARRIIRLPIRAARWTRRQLRRYRRMI